MSDIAIKVENLTKVYKLYNQPIDRLKEVVDPRRKKYHKDFHALNDVSFEIKKGEFVGIVGKNGAGKSTLLKILTGVLTPTSGNLEINGRISSLLELGAGFNPEYTGIQNIYLQGTMFGYSEEEIKGKLDTILEFADIGDFVYQPVKSYSSGMFARLAFATAINVEPEILIVDEALSVGDAFFQIKCLNRMQELIKKGITVLFVSHDTHSIKSFCQKALFLKNGETVACGDVADVVDLYISEQFLKMNDEYDKLTKEKFIHDEEKMIESTDTIPIKVNRHQEDITFDVIRRYGSKKVQVIDVKVLDEHFQEVSQIESLKTCYIQFAVRANEDMDTFSCGSVIKSKSGVQLLGCHSATDGLHVPSIKNGETFIFTQKIKMNLKADIYTLLLSVDYPVVMNRQHEFLDIIEGCKVVEVVWGNEVFHNLFYQKDSMTLTM